MARPDAPTGATPVDADTPERHAGASRVLWMSTAAFTLMFAVWLMFGILGVPIQKELKLTDPQLAWLSAVAVLNGSIWRLPAGMLADRIGGRKVTIAMLLLTAIPAFLLTRAHGYTQLLILAFLVGFAGNLFSVGIAWNSAWTPKQHQGFALGVFGAGNVGASVTKLLLVLFPAIIAGTVGHTYFGIFEGGWRIFPAIYCVALVTMALLVYLVVPRQDRVAGAGKPIGEMLAPLGHIRVWRFSLYYAAVFGAYVALSAWLPKYYVDNFDIELKTAALLTAIFIFPASLLRPVGGWFSDRFGARRVMYWTFGVMLLVTGILMMPNGHIVIAHADGSQSDHLGYHISLPFFVALVFLLGCAMGIGKAAVYKHIPEYFPDNVGSVGGLVGMFGGLGGFVLPPLFAYTKQWSGFPTSTFFVLFLLTAVCAVWMHWTVVHMLHKENPELARHLEAPAATR
ncbi:MFS transporter [Nostocoides australiense]|uniref:Putative nitrite/nitrate transporter (Putative nitrate transporter narT) n=1 Tax=Nostocoides australiense Ben110 TaxID=1193182 RepID=W6JVM2_9MICO|nr:nitrate/nitrite transporter [Tetrasphaera australiensis]MCB1300087.1 NarK/NasA family nitrate transporter [Tetrasphaera sp.]CCH72731.1 putative nitrite/nitrate transporter (putative nitrate transporter narT) [Tetrasphaera australiensis Ben110]HPF79713.1 nitrate/nitrite transporter [Tetrasphaera australiensis]HRW00981.1 nitrate/nitrite transporter [Tetrasphaera sp.]